MSCSQLELSRCMHGTNLGGWPLRVSTIHHNHVRTFLTHCLIPAHQPAA